jgi:hypothetical protein
LQAQADYLTKEILKVQQLLLSKQKPIQQIVISETFDESFCITPTRVRSKSPLLKKQSSEELLKINDKVLI